MHLLQKGSLSAGLSLAYTRPSSAGLGPGERLSLQSAVNPAPASGAGVNQAPGPCLTSALADELWFRAGLRGFPRHVLPSQAVSKRFGLCYRHPIPAWLTPALHLIGFLFCLDFFLAAEIAVEMPLPLRGCGEIPVSLLSAAHCRRLKCLLAGGSYP